MTQLHPNALFVLASASPRRRQLLSDAGYTFDVIPSDIDENPPSTVSSTPAELAVYLSLQKAEAVAARLQHAVVLGADTVVATGGTTYGKASDAAEARQILKALLRTPHKVITGVTVIDTQTGERESGHEITHVEMSPMTAGQLDAYILSGLWQGKAGAYGIQDHDDAFVRRLVGSFSNVVGLPMELTSRMLSRHGVQPAMRSG